MKRQWLLLAFAAAVWPALAAERESASVREVIDADHVSLQLAGEPLTTWRLYGVDAPEPGQPNGDAATDWLRQRLNVGSVQLERYPKEAVRLWRDGQDVGLAMLQAGWAWVDPQRDAGPGWVMRRDYVRAEWMARAQRKGLWANPGAEPPWAWRARRGLP